VPWPVAGAGRMLLDVGCINAVGIYDGVGTLLAEYPPESGSGWHLLAAGDYGVGMVGGMTVSPVHVYAGGSVGVTVGVVGAVVVFSATEDTGTTDIESGWFWAGFVFIFAVGFLGLGARWFGRVVVDNGVNE
jgi:hypothetical protein